MGVPIMDYKALIEALYGIKDGMACGLWSILPLLIVRGRSHLDHIDQGR